MEEKEHESKVSKHHPFWVVMFTKGNIQTMCKNLADQAIPRWNICHMHGSTCTFMVLLFLLIFSNWTGFRLSFLLFFTTDWHCLLCAVHQLSEALLGIVPGPMLSGTEPQNRRRWPGMLLTALFICRLNINAKSVVIDRDSIRACRLYY